VIYLEQDILAKFSIKNLPKEKIRIIKNYLLGYKVKNNCELCENELREIFIKNKKTMIRLSKVTVEDVRLEKIFKDAFWHDRIYDLKNASLSDIHGIENSGLKGNISGVKTYYYYGRFKNYFRKIRACGYCINTLEELGHIWKNHPSKISGISEIRVFNDTKSFKNELLKKYSSMLEKSIKEHKRIENSLNQYKKNLKNARDRKAKKKKSLMTKIVKLLNENQSKLTSSDINAFLKHKNIDEVKECCQELYTNGKIGRTGNYRYFVN
tara:strand:+ start:108 stop:908 length:801 start_codon:yes stop_codon:yes gene_type:complete